MNKIIVHSSDVSKLMDVSPDTARRMLNVIKDAYGKQKHQSVTIREFCAYEGLPYDEVFAMLNGLAPKKTA